MKTGKKPTPSLITAIAVPVLSRGSLIWLGFAAALLIHDSLHF